MNSTVKILVCLCVNDNVEIRENFFFVAEERNQTKKRKIPLNSNEILNEEKKPDTIQRSTIIKKKLLLSSFDCEIMAIFFIL